MSPSFSCIIMAEAVEEEEKTNIFTIPLLGSRILAKRKRREDYISTTTYLFKKDQGRIGEEI